MLGDIAKRWQDLQGKNNWDSLLHPLHPDLRRHLLLYGDLAQSTYDSFISDRRSPSFGACKFSKKNILHRVTTTLAQRKLYTITKYIYSPSNTQYSHHHRNNNNNNVSKWMGFVGVASDEGVVELGRRDVVVVWRGTVLRPEEWVEDLEVGLVPARVMVGKGEEGDEVMVHKGWLSLYTSVDERCVKTRVSARDQVLTEVGRLMDTYNMEKTSITIVGHSLGAALSTLTALDIVSNGVNRPNASPEAPSMVTAILFASHRVGNAAFQRMFTLAPNLKLLRVRNRPDIVPNYPLLGYADVGVELLIDTRDSGFLKRPGNLRTWHNLECYLHGVAGTEGGKNGEFELVVDRAIALVNKNSNALKDEYLVPGFWWMERNKGMVQGSDGRWRLVDHENDDDDV